MAEPAFTVLVTADVYDKFLDRLLVGGEPGAVRWVRVDFARRPDEFPALLEAADAIIARSDLTEAEYARARRLKLLQVPSAGYDKVDVARARRFGVTVANNGGANAISVAEHVFLLVLAIYRNFLVHHRSVVDGSWVCLKHRNLELADKLLGIVGLGRIGREVAVRARAFAMRVQYFDLRRAPEVERRHGVAYVAYERLMRESDVVTFHVPLTSRTRRMADRESLGWMKRGAVLVNTARGGVVDEAALAEALAEGRLLGAGLDVFATEPLPRDSGLLGLDNVVFAPHAGPSHESQFRMIEHVIDNVLRVARGEGPDAVVRDEDDVAEAAPEEEPPRHPRGGRPRAGMATGGSAHPGGTW